MFLSAEMEEASLFLGGISSAPHVSPTSSFSLVFPSGQIKYIYHQWILAPFSSCSKHFLKHGNQKRPSQHWALRCGIPAQSFSWQARARSLSMLSRPFSIQMSLSNEQKRPASHSPLQTLNHLGNNLWMFRTVWTGTADAGHFHGCVFQCLPILTQFKIGRPSWKQSQRICREEIKF